MAQINKTDACFDYYTIDPPTTRRERVCLHLFSWFMAALINFVGAVAIGVYIDRRDAMFEVEMDWGSELTGFGMMDEYYASDDSSEAIEPPPAVESDEDPFESAVEEIAKPTFDAGDVVIPEPEPEPEQVVENEQPKKEEPNHDLSRDKVKLAAVRADVDSLPNLHVLAPGNARLIVLVRNDRVVGSKFENGIRRLFKAFPDYRVALGASDIDPVKDIDALLIATADPRLYAETFLVVSHHIPSDKLREYISASFPTRLKWEERNGRPLATPDSSDNRYHPGNGIYKRSLYLANDGTVLFLKPEVLPTLDVAHVDAIVNTRDEDLEGNPEKAKTFLETLGDISSSDSVSSPTLFLMMQGISNIRLSPGFPVFEPPVAVTASLSTAERPHLNLQASFKSETAAHHFVEVWPEMVSASSKFNVPGLGALLGALSLTDEGSRVLVTGDLNGTMISLVLMFASSYLEGVK